MALITSTEYKLNEYAAKTVIYYGRHKLIEIAKKILVECALTRPSEPKQWIRKNVKRISNEIYQDYLTQGKNGVIKSLCLNKRFVYRIIIFGRPGSGRKTQAINLVTRFNVVLVDAEILISQHLRGNDNQPNDVLDCKLQKAFYYDNSIEKSKALLYIIGRRVLEKDCLTRGWVLVNYPYILDFKNILQNFKIPPNKVVYLKCPEVICMRRLMSVPDLGKPSHRCSYYIQEMRYFQQQEECIDKTLLRRYEIIFINAADSSKNVKAAMFTSLLKSL